MAASRTRRPSARAADPADRLVYLGIHRDISDRKRAERELNEAHRQIEAILQSMGDAFSVLDSEWRYVYVNQRGLERIEELEGEAITLEEIVGKNIWEWFP